MSALVLPNIPLIFGNRPMVANAPTHREQRVFLSPPMTNSGAILCEPPPSTPTRFTGRQKLALMLDNAGYSHTIIAQKMGLRHRQAASRLISRARAAEKELRKAAERFLEAD
jgi:hypothetical protein